MTMKKTNAMRLLDKAGVPYGVIFYDYDPDDLSAVKAAAALGVEPSALFKTLVLRGEPGGVFVCMVAGDDEADLKKAAAASGNKRASMVAVKEIQGLTGYIRGGCTPVGMKKPYPVYIDRACMSKGIIYISAGTRGVQIRIAVDDLIAYTGAVVAELV